MSIYDVFNGGSKPFDKAEKKANKKRPLCRKLHRGLTCH